MEANNAITSVAKSDLNDNKYKYVVTSHKIQNVIHLFIKRPEIKTEKEEIDEGNVYFIMFDFVH